MPEVWGAPLKKGIQFARVLRSPRSMMRFGMRSVLGFLGLSAIVPFILPLIFYFTKIVIDEIVRIRVQAAIDAEMGKMRELYPDFFDPLTGRRLSSDEIMIRQAYRMAVPE